MTEAGSYNCQRGGSNRISNHFLIFGEVELFVIAYQSMSEQKWRRKMEKTAKLLDILTVLIFLSVVTVFVSSIAVR